MCVFRITKQCHRLLQYCVENRAYFGVQIVHAGVRLPEPEGDGSEGALDDEAALKAMVIRIAESTLVLGPGHAEREFPMQPTMDESPWRLML